jgi:hypothetical protein
MLAFSGEDLAFRLKILQKEFTAKKITKTSGALSVSISKEGYK